MKPRCEGKRRMFRRGTYGTFKCGRKATTRVETHVGFTEQHYTCDDEQCQASVTGGYPASSFPLKDL